MKKGVVLFISLLFIAAISLLILKNLEDTDSYISEQNSKFTKTQMMMYLNNAKDEISKALSKNQNNKIKSYLNIDYPIILQDAEITIRLQEYDKYNINLLRSDDKKAYIYIQSFLENNDIYDIDKVFRDVFASEKPQPKIIISYTIPGKGVSFIESDYHWHGKVLNDEQLEKALLELGT